MTPLLNSVLLTFCIGAGATLVMDIWLLLLQRWGIPTLNFALIGRWTGHLINGQIFHSSIAKSGSIRGERPLGWIMHYATGITFAALLLGFTSMSWAEQPTVLPALAMGMSTVAIPLLLIQPAMGAGIASTKTTAPLKNCLKSLLNHSVFGLGLFLSATLIASVTH